MFTVDLDELVTTTLNIALSFPDCRIIGIGQSPAWIIETASIMQKYKIKNISNEFGLVAFSKRFYELKDSYKSKDNKKARAAFALSKIDPTSHEQIEKLSEQLANMTEAQHFEFYQCLDSTLSLTMASLKVQEHTFRRPEHEIKYRDYLINKGISPEKITTPIFHHLF